jgi:hypothetical protein
MTFIGCVMKHWEQYKSSIMATKSENGRGPNLGTVCYFKKEKTYLHFLESPLYCDQ